MLLAALPLDEKERIALLHALRLLDTPPEDVFDRITRLLARTLDVPFALISLVDNDRQWFKSRVGIDVCETPRDVAFCAHAILDSEPLVVSDALDDPRFHDNPLVVGEPRLRFYAGVPIMSANGLALGTLCAADIKPRKLAAADLQVLRDLAAMARHEILQREALLISQRVSAQNQSAADISQAQLLAVFGQASVGILLMDAQLKALRVNSKACEIFGRSEIEMLTLEHKQVSLPEDMVQEAHIWLEMRGGIRDRFSRERRIIRKNGESLWVTMSGSAVLDRDGSLLYFIILFEDISLRKSAEAELRELSNQLQHQVADRTRELRSVLTNAPDAYVALDAEATIVDWNPQASRTFGWSAEEAIGKRMPDLLLSAKARVDLQRGMREYLDSGYSLLLNHRIETSGLHRDGREIALEMSVCAYAVHGGTQFGVFLRDISERKQADMALRRSREQMRAIADNVPAVISHLDRDLVFLFANEGFRTLAKIEPGTLIGRTLAEGLGREQATIFEPYFRQALEGHAVQHEFQSAIDGRFWQSRIVPDVKQGEVRGFYVVTIDITGVKEAELLQRRIAELDELTGLPNRRALLSWMQETFVRADRDNKSVAALFLDLNQFKAINDTYGHDVGDAVLKFFADYLKGSVRSSDMVARLAGDEFVIIADALAHGHVDAQRVADKVRRGLQKTIDIVGIDMELRTSIGIAVRTPGTQLSVDELLAAADKNMYADKRGAQRKLAVS